MHVKNGSLCAKKNIEFNEVADVPWNKNTITKNFNPLGKIPILVEENKEPLFDSKVIVQYLDHINEAQLMYPKDPQDNISARLIESVADGVCDTIVLVFLKNLGMKHCAVMTGFKDKKKDL